MYIYIYIWRFYVRAAMGTAPLPVKWLAPQLYCPNFCLPKHYCSSTIRSNQRC